MADIPMAGLGFPRSWFVDERAAEYECVICTDIVRNATDARCGNGHIFCRSCLQGAMAQDSCKRCPSCRQPCQLQLQVDGQFPLNEFADRQIKQLRVKCVHDACSWIGLLAAQASSTRNYRAHICIYIMCAPAGPVMYNYNMSNICMHSDIAYACWRAAGAPHSDVFI